MTPTFNCIHCGESVPAAVQQKGLTMLCPHCHAEVSIPAKKVVRAQAPKPATMAVAMPRFEKEESDAVEERNFFEAWLSPNMRLRDSDLQRIFTLLCMLVLSVWGYFFGSHTLEGFLLGIFGGLIVGFLVSGFFLMIYRIFRPD